LRSMLWGRTGQLLVKRGSVERLTGCPLGNNMLVRGQSKQSNYREEPLAGVKFETVKIVSECAVDGQVKLQTISVGL
jgi:hypothetical protein